MFCFIVLTIEFIVSLSSGIATLVVPETSSTCFEFLCFVKPPFGLQILLHILQGQTIRPSISFNASINSFSTYRTSFSTISIAIFMWKATSYLRRSLKFSNFPNHLISISCGHIRLRYTVTFGART